MQQKIDTFMNIVKNHGGGAKIVQGLQNTMLIAVTGSCITLM